MTIEEAKAKTVAVFSTLNAETPVAWHTDETHHEEVAKSKLPESRWSDCEITAVLLYQNKEFIIKVYEEGDDETIVIFSAILD
jgi:hypothetical protein